MRKVLSSILVLTLACLLPLTALAATVVETVELPKGLNASLSEYGELTVQVAHEGYWKTQIVNAAGEAITPPYYFISGKEHDRALFIAGLGQNSSGLLNGRTGEIIVPAEYTIIDVLSEKWVVGIRLKPGTVPESDNLVTWYSYGAGDIVDVDVYYGAQKVATLTAEEWGIFKVFGEYLMIGNNQNAISLNPRGEKITMDRNRFTYEFEEDYKTKVVIHNPTGQEAFVPGCTLTVDEVDRAYWMKNEGIVDLQGNVILAREAFPYEDLYLRDSHGDYLLISHEDEETSKDLYGVLDKTGKLIIPCELINWPTLSAETPWFTNGVLAVITHENKLNFYDAAGTVLSSVELGENEIYSSDLGNEIIGINCTDGTTLYASAAKGLLDISAYEDTYGYYSHNLLNVKQNGLWGVMDQNGEVIIPCIHEYTIKITDDGTMALGCYYTENNEKVNILYTIEH